MQVVKREHRRIKYEVLKSKTRWDKLIHPVPTYDDELRDIAVKHEYYGKSDNKIKVVAMF